jgi:hypothetical protein
MILINYSIKKIQIQCKCVILLIYTDIQSHSDSMYFSIKTKEKNLVHCQILKYIYKMHSQKWNIEYEKVLIRCYNIKRETALVKNDNALKFIADIYINHKNPKETSSIML